MHLIFWLIVLGLLGSGASSLYSYTPDLWQPVVGGATFMLLGVIFHHMRPTLPTAPIPAKPALPDCPNIPKNVADVSKDSDPFEMFARMKLEQTYKASLTNSIPALERFFQDTTTKDYVMVLMDAVAGQPVQILDESLFEDLTQHQSLHLIHIFEEIYRQNADFYQFLFEVGGQYLVWNIVRKPGHISMGRHVFGSIDISLGPKKGPWNTPTQYEHTISASFKI